MIESSNNNLDIYDITYDAEAQIKEKIAFLEEKHSESNYLRALKIALNAIGLAIDKDYVEYIAYNEWKKFIEED